MGNEWLPLTPPANLKKSRCEWKADNGGSARGSAGGKEGGEEGSKVQGMGGRWLTPSNEECALHLHMGHKIKGSPGRWEFRSHKVRRAVQKSPAKEPCKGKSALRKRPADTGLCRLCKEADRRFGALLTNVRTGAWGNGWERGSG